MRSVSTLARWLHQVRSLGSSAAKERRERTVRRLRALDQAVDPWLAEERVLLSAPAVVLSVASATYTENAPPVTLDPAVMASDPDADFITAAQVKIVDFAPGQDQLSFTPQFGITGSFDSMTGILSLNGVGTASQYATVLSSVQYQNLSDAPSDLTRTIEYSITDTEPLPSNVATLTLNLISVADTPANVMATVNEDTLSAPIVLLPNPIDGATVTHFQITGITNGTLYQNDGVTVINDGDFITAAEAANGVKFQGSADYFGPAEFKFQAAVGNTLADLGGAKATAAITVNAVADTPANVMATVDEEALSAPIVLAPNGVDGASVTHFQITGITNGTLYQADGITVINNGDFVTLAQATAGLRYQGNTDYFGPAEFKYQAATGGTVADLGGAKATAAITVNPIADTPANVMASVNEDTLSLPIILVPNAVDGASVTHFQITGITNGTLYQADGVTVINNGDFITLAQATAGVTFQGNADYFGPAEFKYQAATGNTLTDLGGAKATAAITVNPISDTPPNIMATVNEDTLSAPIVLTPNAVDGASVTHFQITGITNGTLYLNDGVTVVNNGDFVTVADAALGLKYQGNANYFGPAQFQYQAAVGNSVGDLGGNLGTASITVSPLADTPADVVATVNEDTLSAPITLTPNAVDGASVTHFQITGITNGTLYLNDGVTVVNNGDFVTGADAALGLKTQGNTNYFGPAQFQYQASTSNAVAGLAGGLGTASITVNPIADTPADVMATVNEDTLSAPIILTPNAVDGASITHFQITGITNGTLYLNDGVTVVNNGDFVTVTDAALGLKYQGNLNYFGPAEFKFQAATGNMVANLGGAKATAAITVVSINDDPTIIVPGPQMTDEGTVLAVNGILIDDADVAGNLMTVKFQTTGPTATYTLGTTTGITFLNGTTNGGSTPLEIQGTLADLQAALATLQVQPHDNGTLNLTLVITDELNGSAQATIPITVANVPPTLTLTGPAPNTVNEGDFVTVTGSATDPANPPTTPSVNDPHTYTWSVTKDGNAYTSGTTSTVNFQVNDNAVYVVTMTVTDGDGGSDTETYTINVANVPPTLTLTGPAPNTVNEGDFVTVTGSATDPANTPTTPTDNDPLTYTWSVTKDGNAYTSGVGNVANFQVVDNGVYVVTMTVNDDDLGSDTEIYTINVANVPPTLTLTGPAPNTVNEGDFVTVSGSATDPANQPSTPTDNDPHTYTWSVTKNGNAYTSGTTSTANFQVNDNGVYVVTMTVTDGDGGSDTETYTINVANVPPTLTLTGPAPNTVNEGDFVTVTGSATDPANPPTTPSVNDPHTYTWSVTKDGNAYTSGTTSTVNFQVNDNAVYVVTMTVTDGDGGSDTETYTINVANVPPTLTLTGPATANEGAFVTVTGSATDPANPPTTPSVNDPHTYTWSVTKDGNAYTSGTGNVANFQVVDNGVYVVTMTVTDGDGGSDTEMFTINVANVPPTLTLTGPAPNTVNEGAFVTVTGSATDPANPPTTPSVNDPLTYVWSVTKDGNAYTSGVGNVANFQVVDNGVYVVTMTVTDDDLGSDTETYTINVANVAPTPTVTGDTTGFEGTGINLAASSTDPANQPTTPTNNDSVAYTWSVTKNGTAYASGSGTNFTLTPDNEGTYVVTMTAADEDGGSRSTTHTIVVANVAPVANINATDIDGQFYTYVDMAVADPGNDNITVTIVWGDINPDDYLYDPLVTGETATDRTFGTVTHRYLNAPNPQDPLAPVTITFFISDGTTTVVQTVVVQVTGQGIPAGGVYVTPEPEEIILPQVQAVVLPPSILTQPNQQQNRNEEIVSREETQTDEEARLVLHVVGPTGVEGPAVTLPDGLLKNLRGLFAKLPDGHYRVYLVQGESRRLVIEVFVRQGRAIDPAEVDQGTQERPPQVQPAAQQEPERVMQADRVANLLCKLELPARDAEPFTTTSPDLDATTNPDLLTEQVGYSAPSDPQNEPETPENADQAGALSLAAAGVVAGESWRRVVRRKRASAVITGPESGKKVEKTWSRLARRARQWKPR